MMTARSKLDGHLAYNEFRFLYECILYLRDEYKPRLIAASESKMLESSAADQLDDAGLVEVLQEVLKLRDTEIATQDTEIATLKAEIVTLQEQHQ